MTTFSENLNAFIRIIPTVSASINSAHYHTTSLFSFPPRTIQFSSQVFLFNSLQVLSTILNSFAARNMDLRYIFDTPKHFLTKSIHLWKPKIIVFQYGRLALGEIQQWMWRLLIGTPAGWVLDSSWYRKGRLLNNLQHTRLSLLRKNYPVQIVSTSIENLCSKAILVLVAITISSFFFLFLIFFLFCFETGSTQAQAHLELHTQG